MVVDRSRVLVEQDTERVRIPSLHTNGQTHLHVRYLSAAASRVPYAPLDDGGPRRAALSRAVAAGRGAFGRRGAAPWSHSWSGTASAEEDVVDPDAEALMVARVEPQVQRRGPSSLGRGVRTPPGPQT